MTEHKFNLLDPLSSINPGSLSYTEWVNVGMALKYEGYSVSDWESWSRNDQGGGTTMASVRKSGKPLTVLIHQ